MISSYVKGWIVAAAVLSVLLAAILLYDRGRDSAYDAIEKQNDKAGGAATGGAVSWRGCVDRGGLYDFASGECGRPTEYGGK